jgi:superfamily II RNA helicase
LDIDCAQEVKNFDIGSGINDIELGSSIEKIIQFIDCPVLGLSATISNFDQFYNWFSSIEKFKRFSAS